MVEAVAAALREDELRRGYIDDMYGEHAAALCELAQR